MKGSYILIIQVKKDMKVKIGKLGILSFKRGYYAYVGSAMNGLEGRIRHHLRHNKKMHWHIDYFLSKAEIKEIPKRIALNASIGAKISFVSYSAIKIHPKPLKFLYPSEWA